MTAIGLQLWRRLGGSRVPGQFLGRESVVSNSWLDLNSLETSFFERPGAFEVFDDWQPTPRRTYRYYGAH